MKARKFFLLFFLISGIFTLQAAAQNYWTPFQGETAPTKGQVTLLPKAYEIMQLNQGALLGFLNNLDSQPENAQLIRLPAPDGAMMEFRIWETSIMPAGLQKRYLGIKTFTAVAVQDPRITAKVDYTAKGFHAMVYAGDKTFLINPYSNVPDGYYITYYKKDFTMPLDERMVCEVGEKDEMSPKGAVRENLSGELPKLGLKENGSTKRNYRLALSCTGEYAVAVAGNNPTILNVFSAMTTTMNRVNGIYEREIAVSMTFVDSEDHIIYLNPATDPFTANNNGPNLLGQNQSNLSAAIGNDNYDIGHIFSTGGGGIASLQSVCSNYDKGQGVTGLGNPVGDAFDVDYVAHEMGHQFGANHTFNDCNGNENQATAYEPGSGSTIMAYAGICGSYNDLQNHSSAYFHAVSLSEISDFLVGNNTWGDGSTCGTASAGSPPPVLPSITTTDYKIPFETPFELTAPIASTPDPDSLAYNWEQWDLGNLQADDTGAANFVVGPCLRSYTPTTDGTRTFPLLDSIINNNTEFIGGHLPEVARSMAFKLTTRNIVNGWGTFDIADSVVNIDVINTGTPFLVTSPNASNIFWSANHQETITWDKAQTDLAPISCAKVNVYLSKDGGFTYPYTLAENIPNTGTAIVTAPNINTTKARVKIKGAGNVFFDISNEDFTVTGATGIADATFQGPVTVSPNPAKDALNVKNASGDSLKLALYDYAGREVWEGSMQSAKTINVQRFSRGLYFLHLNNERDGTASVLKIVLK